MPETLTVQVKEVRIKEGTNAKGKPWKSRLLVDANDDFIGSSFKAVLDNVKPGQTVEVEREQDGDYYTILSAKPAAANSTSIPQTSTPVELGTGQYVKGKEAPETRAGIAAAVALKEAVNWAKAEPNPDITTVLVAADKFFDWLMSKTAAAAPEKPAQSVPGASEQAATEGQLKEIGQLMVTLGSHAPASPDPNWTWADEVRRYTEANFNKKKSTDLTKAEAHQVIGHLEERITAIQAEARIPF